MKNKLFIWSIFLLTIASIVSSKYASSEEKRYESDENLDAYEPEGFLFTSPRTLKTGENNELHFQLYGCEKSGILEVKVTGKKDYENPTEVIAASKTFKIKKGKSDVVLHLPVKKFDDYIYDAIIAVSGKFGDYKFSGNDSISLVNSQENIMIVQTDKSLYQPGQTVKFRILKVNEYLKPSGEDNIAQVYVEDSKGTRLFEFDDLDLSKGIVQRDFLLSDEPVKGIWRINASTNKTTEIATLEVKDYVLPKFDVEIKVPSYVLGNSKSIPIKICAKYTYGKPLVGTLNLNVSLEKYWYSQDDKYPTLQESVEINGCYDYDINVEQIEPDGQFTYRRIEIVANVIQTGTGVQRNVTEYISRVTTPLNLQFTDQREYYKPGLPFNGKVKVTNPDNTPAANELIEICATTTKQRVLAEWWATKKIKICQNYTSGEDGLVNYIVFSKNVDDVSIELNARAPKYSSTNDGKRDNILYQPQTSAYLRPFYSPSGSFIQIQPVTQPVACGTMQRFKLLFTAKSNDEFKFYYQINRQAELVLSDSLETSFSFDDDVSSEYENDDRIISSKKTLLVPSEAQIKQTPKTKKHCPAAVDSPYSPPIGEVNIDIKINEDFSPEFHLLVYYIREDRETVADSVKIEVEKCFRNKVDFAFGDEIQQPGLTTSVQITAAPHSLCGIKAVDKSLLLLDNRDQLTKDTVFQKLSVLDVNSYYTNNPCYRNTIQPGLANSRFKGIIRPIPPVYGSNSYEDALTSFQTSGLLTISDFWIFTRPCTENTNSVRPIPLRHSMSFAKSAKHKGAVLSDAAVERVGAASSTVSVKEVRDNFPETWLFELEMTGADGTFEAKEQLPDTITEWVGSAVCVNSNEGLGISNTVNITAFQAFFIDFTLPISVIRGETFEIIVTIFNYLNGSLPITVSLSEINEFEVVGNGIDGDYCVEADASISVPIKLKAKKIGAVNFTVGAESSESTGACKGSEISNVYARDAITKHIEVEAEGFPVENVINTLVCLSDENNMHEDTIALSLPDDVIEDSARAYMDFSGNVMGPTIKNLNRLVTLPTGCGEQNMVKFTPNYIVLDYLTSINMLTDDIKSKAIRNLNLGYQRQLNYRHNDGSFSAFGETDKQGSTFLSAFVLLSFYQAKRYIYIDDNIIKGAQNWLIARQNADGCFQNLGKIIDIGLEGGVDNDKSSASITAYVAAALIISELDNEKVLNGAFTCLEKNPPSNPYSQVLYAYTHVLGGRTSEALKYITEARQKLSSTGGMEFFNIINGTDAITLETNAYAILTTLKVDGSASDVIGYVRYMTSHLNPYGGFQTTQATCVGLEALAQFGKIINKDPLDLEVTTTGGLKQKVSINNKNKLLVQRYKVSDIPTDVTIEAEGTGCALIQTALRYNSKTPPEKKMFSLEVKGECSYSGCSHATINVLVSYLPPGRTAGMSIFELKLITGFVAVRSSLDELKSDERNKILRIDVESNTVIFYFSEISNKVQSFFFQLEQVVSCQNAQPGTAKVYDYYANENSKTVSYTIDGLNSDNQSEKE